MNWNFGPALTTDNTIGPPPTVLTTDNMIGPHPTDHVLPSSPAKKDDTAVKETHVRKPTT